MEQAGIKERNETVWLMWSTSSSRFISNLMEYGYSSTIIALVEMSALLFFPYTLEWVECDSWAFNKLHEF